MRIKLLLLTLSIGILSPLAQDVSKMFDSETQIENLMSKSEWVSNYDLNNPAVLSFLTIRSGANAKYFSNILREVSQLSHEEQLLIVIALETKVVDQKYSRYVENLRVPEALQMDIIAEAKTHKKISERRIKAIENTLRTWRESGDPGEKKISYLKRYSPRTIELLPDMIVINLLLAEGERLDSGIKVATEENKVATEENKVATEENKVATEENKLSTQILELLQAE